MYGYVQWYTACTGDLIVFGVDLRSLFGVEMERVAREGVVGGVRASGASEGGGMGGTRRVTCLWCVVVVHINLTLSLS